LISLIPGSADGGGTPFWGFKFEDQRQKRVNLELMKSGTGIQRRTRRERRTPKQNEDATATLRRPAKQDYGGQAALM
jgi:hypothetical protein